MDWVAAIGILAATAVTIAMLNWATTALTTDPTDRPSPPRPRHVRAFPARAFTAVSDCPSCGEIAVHPWREPTLNDVRSPYDMGPGIAHVVAWCGNTIKTTGTLPPTEELPWNRDDHNTITGMVVRQCKCGQEWREK